jgi:hypothetical protein
MEDGIKDELTPELSLAPEGSEEDKVPEMIPVLDHGHAPHGHGRGVPWLDVIVGLSAIFISVVSLVVSIEHGKTMEKMVDQNQKMVVASTLPLLDSVIGSDLTSKNKYIQLSVKNSGVGPAIIDRFEIRYKGVSYISSGKLLKACCAEALQKDAQKVSSSSSSVSGSILPARETINVLEIHLEKSPHLLNSLLVIQPDVTLKACYCSVLDECWETSFDHKRPQPVKECKVTPGEQLW